jgi:hypothetical protein
MKVSTQRKRTLQICKIIYIINYIYIYFYDYKVMALERTNTPSSLENIKVSDTFSLSYNVQAPCFEENSFQKDDILEVTHRNEKSSETGTTWISFVIIRKGKQLQNHVMSLGIFINNFDNKLDNIAPENNVDTLVQSTNENLNNLVSNA